MDAVRKIAVRRAVDHEKQRIRQSCMHLVAREGADIAGRAQTDLRGALANIENLFGVGADPVCGTALFECLEDWLRQHGHAAVAEMVGLRRRELKVDAHGSESVAAAAQPAP